MYFQFCSFTVNTDVEYQIIKVDIISIKCNQHDEAREIIYIGSNKNIKIQKIK